jgi:hypothetical protein
MAVEPLSQIYRREADRLLWIVQTLQDPEAREEFMQVARRYAALAQRAKEREKREQSAPTSKAG